MYTTKTTLVETEDYLYRLFQYYSDWYKLRKTVAWLLKMKVWLKLQCQASQHVSMKEAITVSELHEAKIVKNVQRRAFLCEINALTTEAHAAGENVSLKKSNHIFRLKPMKCADVLLRVGGRLNSHPIILSKIHPVVKMIVQHYHAVSGHCGKEHTLSLI